MHTLGTSAHRAFALAGGAVVLTLLTAAPAAAIAFSNIYFFGDSLSDSGIACTALVGSDPRYFPGRCSNGPVWTEQFAAALGHDAQPATLGGDNYAVGAAKTIDSAGNDLESQIDVFEVSATGGATGADENALYVIWLGGNDVFEMPPIGDIPTRVGEIITGMQRLQGITGLGGAGALHFLIPNLPDIGRTHGDFDVLHPGTLWTDPERTTLETLSLAFNGELDTQLAALGPGFDVFRLDVFQLLEDVFANPAAFGIDPSAMDTSPGGKDYAVACLIDSACDAASPLGGNPAPGTLPTKFVIFDEIHPTTTAHGVIAARAVTVVPEPGGTPLVATGLALLGLRALQGANRGPITPRTDNYPRG